MNNQVTIEKIVELLRREVRPALGCTEPAAVALACAYAAQGLEGPVERVEVAVDPNVFKNGMGVYVPGTALVGLTVSAALGALIADPTMELQVLQAVTPTIRDRALELIEQGKVVVRPEGDFGELKIVATVVRGKDDSTAVISGSHTNLSALYHNGKEVMSKPVFERAVPELEWLQNMLIADIAKVIEGQGEQLRFLLDLARTNLDVATKGVAERLGVGLGYAIRELLEQGRLGSDYANKAMCYTAGAADARMSGSPYTVISTNGSGNQGITASVPLVVIAGEINSPEDKLAEALAMSHMLTIYVKLHIGKLSASCACAMAAAIGSSCGIAHLLGYGVEEMKHCVGIMAANLTGMICDGAKVSCSFKLATAVCTAVQTALLSGSGVIAPASDGILAVTPEETIRNMGAVSNPGMRETDRVILGLMQHKSAY